MFISIMSGVIGEVTRQSPVAPRMRAETPRSDAATPRATRRARVRPATRPAAALPGTYRVLAASFRRAAGFHA